MNPWTILSPISRTIDNVTLGTANHHVYKKAARFTSVKVKTGLTKEPVKGGSSGFESR